MIDEKLNKFKIMFLSRYYDIQEPSFYQSSLENYGFKCAFDAANDILIIKDSTKEQFVLWIAEKFDEYQNIKFEKLQPQIYGYDKAICEIFLQTAMLLNTGYKL